MNKEKVKRLHSAKKVWQKIFGWGVGDYVKIFQAHRSTTEKAYYFGRIVERYKSSHFYTVALCKKTGIPYKSGTKVFVPSEILEHWNPPKRQAIRNERK